MAPAPHPWWSGSLAINNKIYMYMTAAHSICISYEVARMIALKIVVLHTIVLRAAVL
jgi:hypothetical protein